MDGQSLLQKTYLRAAMLPAVESILTVTNTDYFYPTYDEYQDIQTKNTQHATIKNSFLLEPVGRNTAPAVAMAALMLSSQYGDDAVMLVLSADHLIEGDDDFLAAVRQAHSLADDGHLVTFGMPVIRPETGYGYIKRAAQDKESIGGYRVERFVEKPTLELAKAYMESGDYFWNAGIFCCQAGKLLNELKLHCPEVYTRAKASWTLTCEQKQNVADVYEIDRNSFAGIPSISLDYAVMEKSDKVAVVPSAFLWSDIGSWDALSDFIEADNHDNRIDGKAVVIDSNNLFIQSRKRTVAAVGIKDLIIVDTDDAVLIAHRTKTQDVKRVVEQLKSDRNSVYRDHGSVTTSWGSYPMMEDSDVLMMKRVTVKSRQLFEYAPCEKFLSGHFVVVSGQCRVILNGETVLLSVGDSYSIPKGQSLKIENIGQEILSLIDIQNKKLIDDKFSSVILQNVV